MTPLSAMLAKAAVAAGYAPKGGIARLHRLLVEQYGVRVSHSAVSFWLNGQRRPEMPHLRALLDALDIQGEDRKQIVELALPSGLLHGNREPDAAA